METDGQTRVYGQYGNELVHPVWPNLSLECLGSAASREVRERADATATGEFWIQGDRWVIKSTDRTQVPMEGEGEHKYRHLAGATEELLKRSGVTILCS